MSAKAFNKIASGLREAISVVRGESEPARIYVRPITPDMKQKIDDLVGDVEVDLEQPLIRSTPVAPAEMEMINEKSAAETSPRKVEEIS